MDYELDQLKQQLPTDDEGNTPLHTVCSNVYSLSTTRQIVLKKLLSHGYKADERNKRGKTACDYLHSADWRLKILRSFIAAPIISEQANCSTESANLVDSTLAVPESVASDSPTVKVKPVKGKKAYSISTMKKTKKKKKAKKPSESSKKVDGANSVNSSSLAPAPAQVSDIVSEPLLVEPTIVDGDNVRLHEVAEEKAVVSETIRTFGDRLRQSTHTQAIRNHLLEAISSLPQKKFVEQLLKKGKDHAVSVQEIRLGVPEKENSSVLEDADVPWVEPEDVLSPDLHHPTSRRKNDTTVQPAGTDFVTDETDEVQETAWEVRCTTEVQKFLRRKKSDPQIVSQVLRKLKMLARGEFRSRLCRPIKGVHSGAMLFEGNVTGGVRLIWDITRAFSPLLSLAQGEQRLRQKRHVFSEVIRVWHVLLDHDNMNQKIKEIMKSYEKGNSAANIILLEGDDDNAFEEENLEAFLEAKSKRGPTKYFSKQDRSLKGEKREYKCFPPANPDDKEYSIIKFYPFDEDMMKSIASDCGRQMDFLFDVNPDEFEIINSKDNVSILLLGRSGTGKTTCCLHRMWRSFELYWKSAKVENPYYWRKIFSAKRSRSPEESAEQNDLPYRKALPPSDVKKDEFEEVQEADGLTDILPPAALRDHSDNVVYTVPQKEAATAIAPTSVAPECGSETDMESVSSSLESVHEESYHLQQIFITKNGFLCDRMRRSFLGLSHAHSFTTFHLQHEKTRLPFRLQEFEAVQFPCFLTMRQWLFLLDASLPSKPFFPRSDNGALACKIRTSGDNDSLLDLLEDTDSESDSGDDGGSASEEEEEELADVSSHLVKFVDHTSVSGKDEHVFTEITFSYFETVVWPGISKQFSSYDPSLVWTEIKSFIKGSVEAMESKNCAGYLELEEYLKIGGKRAPNFKGNREDVYEMFEQYRKFKRKLFNAYDECDLVFNLFRRLAATGHRGWTVNQLFVDEVQDFTQAEIALLVGCCEDRNGLFFTGDTAQSIMRGVSFRFTDLQTMFYENSQADPKVKLPSISHLTQNYRSHSGILEVASSVVALMERFFKNSFDLLPKDNGHFSGPRPSYLVRRGNESLSELLALVLMGNRRKTSALEFGAHQVILVRSEEAMKDLPEELKCAICLTVFEAKGLEFDDVLLYNFFTDSKVSVLKKNCTNYSIVLN